MDCTKKGTGLKFVVFSVTLFSPKLIQVQGFTCSGLFVHSQ